jgi:hypothetical protein
LADVAERPVACWFVFAVGAQERGAEGVHVLLEVGAGEALVADHDLAGFEDALEQFGGDDAFGRVRCRELEADGQPVGGADKVEAKAPEPAAV